LDLKLERVTPELKSSDLTRRLASLHTNDLPYREVLIRHELSASIVQTESKRRLSV